MPVRGTVSGEAATEGPPWCASCRVVRSEGVSIVVSVHDLQVCRWELHVCKRCAGRIRPLWSPPWLARA